MRILSAVLATVLMACASAPRPDPTPTHPLIGCLWATQNQQARVAGKILPEPVRIIGEYEHDSDQWMVVRGTFDPQACTDLWDRDRCPWQPMPKASVRLVGCGAETNAMQKETP